MLKKLPNVFYIEQGGEEFKFVKEGPDVWRAYLNGIKCSWFSESQAVNAINSKSWINYEPGYDFHKKELYEYSK